MHTCQLLKCSGITLSNDLLLEDLHPPDCRQLAWHQLGCGAAVITRRQLVPHDPELAGDPEASLPKEHALYTGGQSWLRCANTLAACASGGKVVGGAQPDCKAACLHVFFFRILQAQI